MKFIKNLLRFKKEGSHNRSSISNEIQIPLEKIEQSIQRIRTILQANFQQKLRPHPCPSLKNINASQLNHKTKEPTMSSAYSIHFNKLKSQIGTDLTKISPDEFYHHVINNITEKYFPAVVLEIKNTNYVAVPVLNNKKIWVNLFDQHVSRNLLLAHEWELNETFFVKKYLKSNQTFLDIGANIGWFTLLASEIVGDGGNVISFEPRPDLFRLLKKSIVESNIYSITEPHNVALGESSGHIKIFDIDPKNPGATSIFNTGGADVTEWNVPMKKLDDIIHERPVDFIKIDVEGAELLVFKGATSLLSNQKKPIIMSEINPQQLKNVSGIKPIEYVEYINSFGYICHLIDSGEKQQEILSTHDFGNDISSVAFFPR